ncbi:redox-regulated ATPase YchF [Candidatus Woesearchaeota archaeon]|nr:redox-regulated ATPase YchF [Candidatus Woesearchaeota archaeon]
MLIGVVGKTNVGKSTFFKAATLANVLIGNYPFATIKPNHGIGFVKIDCVDKEFNVQCNPRKGFCIEHKRFVPVELLDVAGLVPGAHEGKGLGNQFLNDLNQADVLIHVIDASGSTNERGETVEAGSYNPVSDIEFLEIELDYWYMDIIKKGWEKFAKKVQQEHANIVEALTKQLSGLKVTEEMIKKSLEKLRLTAKNPETWDEKELFNLARELRIKSKPIIIAANKIDIANAEKNLEELKNKFTDYTIIGCSAEAELALKEADHENLIKYIPGENDFEYIKKENMNEKQIKGLNFIKENVLKKYSSTGVQDTINRAVFDVLKYKIIFSGGIHNLEDKDGNILPDCFLLPKDATALDFAYAIHTNIGDKFVKAIDGRTGKALGKEHVLKHRDVIRIVN